MATPWEEFVAKAPRTQYGSPEDQTWAQGRNASTPVGGVYYAPNPETGGGMSFVAGPGDASQGIYNYTKGPNGEVVKTYMSPQEFAKQNTNDSWISKYGWMVPLAMAGGIGAASGNSMFGGAANPVASMAQQGWTSGYDLPMGATIDNATGQVLTGADEGFWEIGSGGQGGMAGGNTVGDTIAGGGAGSLSGTAYGAGGPLSTLNNIAKSPAGTSAVQKILSGNASMQDWLGLLGPAMSIGSGLYGLDKAKDYSNLVSGDVNSAMARLGGISITPPNLAPVNSPPINVGATAIDRSAQAKAAIAGADPWGASGGRDLADTQLQALMKSPGSLLTDPGYQARMMGVDRVMAAQGQLGGGGGAVAAANASGDYYTQRLAALAALENMGNPVGAQQVGLGQENLGVSQGELNLHGQTAAATQGIQLGQLDTQRGQLGLDAQKAMANLGVSQGQLGLDAAKLKLAAAGGANTLAGQSLASMAYGVTKATGGDTQMEQARAFLDSLRAYQGVR